MSYYKVINGNRWYYKLVPKEGINGRKIYGLFSDYPRHTLAKGLIIRRTYVDSKSGKTRHLYSHFKSYVDYAIFSLKIPENKRAFYEIILGEHSQKPHFDLDITSKVDGNIVKDNLITAIIEVLQENGVQLDLEKDVLIYTSHGSTDNGWKQSYHILINNYCHANNEEAKAFYSLVIQRIKEEYRQYIDQSVYSPTQHFRIVGCQKIGSNRIKELSEKWTYQGQEIVHQYPEKPEDENHLIMMRLEESIVGYTGGCKYLPPFMHVDTTVREYDESPDITREDALDALKMVASKANISTRDPRFPYRFKEINGPFVVLQRIKPSRCRLCNRVHENENPYLMIVGEEKAVYFHCRRSRDNKKLFIGKLEPNPDIVEDISTDQNDQSDQGSSIVHENKVAGDTWRDNVLKRLQELAQSDRPQTGKKVKILQPEHKSQILNKYVGS